MLVELLMNFVLQIIGSIGYLGIFLLMLAESTVLPVPSELVLPFAGYLVSSGQLDLILTILSATLGTIVGALISYYIGKFVGRAFVERYGKYVLLNTHDLELAHKWFEKHGDKIIFICRFIPAVRHVISIPAGTAEMKRRKFITYTALGGLIWNSFLVWVGMLLQKNWNEVVKYTEGADLVIIAIVVVAIIGFLVYKYKKGKR